MLKFYIDVINYLAIFAFLLGIITALLIKYKNYLFVKKFVNQPFFNINNWSKNPFFNLFKTEREW